MAKINCLNPNHKDSEPSMEIYNDGLHCFSCGYSCPLEGVLSENEIKQIKKEKPEPENIEEKIVHIENLPTKTIRGLRLPYDENGYYIVWPDKAFYKKRISTNSGSRYVGPRGHRPPLFWCKPQSKHKQVLIVTEGEINCLSLDLALDGSCYGVDIVSPGSANSFEDFINIYVQYTNVYLIVDKDPAGLACGKPVYNFLISKGKRCKLIAVKPDFNDTLIEGGKEAVLKQFKEELGL